MKVKLCDFEFSADMMALYGIEVLEDNKQLLVKKPGFVFFPIDDSMVEETELIVRVIADTAALTLDKSCIGMQVTIFPVNFS